MNVTRIFLTAGIIRLLAATAPGSDARPPDARTADIREEP